MSDAQPTRRGGMTLGARRRLSPDELSAEDARIIEENFPKQRTLHLRPNGGAIQKSDRNDIVVTEEVLLATAHHVAQDMTKESGGFLLGNRYECPNTKMQYIIVDQYMKADYTEGTQVSLTFTTDSWAQLKDRLDGKYRGKSLVGWYHSHPGMGIFLSNYDVDIHKNRFANEWDVALVLDPVKHEGGFFAWIDGNVNPREKVDFYELLDGDSRETVVAWTNYTAEDPKTNAAASLKAVNTQNSDGNPLTASSAQQRAQTATAKSGLLSNPYAIMGGAAVLLLLLLGTVFAGYWMFFRNKDDAGGNSNTLISDKNKVLIAKNIRIGDNLKGWVSSDNKMTVDFEVKGVGTPEVLEQVRKDLEVEINGQATTVTSEVANGSFLKVRAVSILPNDVAQGFNSEKQQNFKMRVEMAYGEDVMAKSINTEFHKGKGKNDMPSLGDLVGFGDIEEENVAPVKKKPVVTDKQNESEKTDRDKEQQQQTQTTPKKNNQTQTRATVKPTQPRGQTVDNDPGVVNRTRNRVNRGVNSVRKAVDN